MASVQSIAKAQAVGKLLYSFTGIEPQYTYYDDYVNVFYKQSDIPAIQSKIDSLIKNNSGKKSDIQIDYLPLISNLLIKKVLPYGLGLILIGYIIGKKF
jgi:hypothetical protein